MSNEPEIDVKKLTARLENISDLVDAAYGILKYTKGMNTEGSIKLTETEVLTLDSWLKSYTLLAVQLAKDNGNYTIH